MLLLTIVLILIVVGYIRFTFKQNTCKFDRLVRTIISGCCELTEAYKQLYLSSYRTPSDKMLLLIFLFLVYSEVSLSSLGPNDHSSNSSPDVSTRTTAGIFWSCFTTLIACTWTSIHPNIPARETSEWQLWWQRGKIFLIALVAPELIIHWALIQYRCSRQTVREFRRLFPDCTCPFYFWTPLTCLTISQPVLT